MSDASSQRLDNAATPDATDLSVNELLRRNRKLKKQVVQLQEDIVQLQKKITVLKNGRDALRERLNAERSRAARADRGVADPLDARRADPLYHNSACHMNEFYSSIDNIDRYQSGLQTSVYRLMLSTLRGHIENDPVSILDAGCGLGIMSAMLKDCFSSASVVAFDFSTVAVDRARQGRSDVTFFVHDIYDPLDDHFDLIICTETLEHLLEPEAALHRLMESAAPSGALFLTVPDGRIDQSDKHINFWSPESWQRFLIRAAPGHTVQTGLIQHPERKQLRYNWGSLSPSS